ncbi:heat shock 70 kDa protein II-like [Planococcus citri]|uniref:heat shock 70 kDa protein II-like n=1 Tax=Planococcus citri TaxID=170843 RepID=UPI0031F97FB5
MNSPAIGIDLGTTYSCVGVFQHGQVEIIANDQGDRTTPSCVAFTDIETFIGEAAKSQSTRNVDNTIFHVKRLMGRKFEDDTVQADMKKWPFNVIDDHNKPKIEVTVRGATETYYAEEISSMVLGKMKDIAEAYLGKTVKNAVITVPAYFNDSQRAATIDAAKIAGLNVLRIINEPTAAAIAYGLDKKDSRAHKVLIFDLGGGTFDVSILTIQNSVFEVNSTAGNTHLGGEDFDSQMVNHFVQEFKQKYKKDLTRDKRAVGRLRVACERAKRILSSTTAVNIELDCLHDGIDFYSSITRARFEELNSYFFQNAMGLVEKAIQDARISKTQIDRIVLVGGSSRIPKIQKMLQDFFDGKELNKTINPDEAVAYGAAIQAAILNGDSSIVVQDVVLFDVTPLSLGVAVNKEGSLTEEDDTYMSVIIKRNTAIPARHTRQGYRTLVDNQTAADIEVYEGECTLTKYNHLLGRFTLEGFPPAPAGAAEADVTFEIDANGVLNVTAIGKSIGNMNQITIAYDRGRLSKSEIQRVIREAEKRRIKEEYRKASFYAKNSLESYCVDLKSTVQNPIFGDEIDKFDKDLILKKCEETITWINSFQSPRKELFERKQNELKGIFDVIIFIASTPNRRNEKYRQMLNVEKDASQSEIEKAFRDIACKYHPDKYQGDKELSNAYWLYFVKAKNALIRKVK